MSLNEIIAKLNLQMDEIHWITSKKTRCTKCSHLEIFHLPNVVYLHCALPECRCMGESEIKKQAEGEVNGKE